MPNSLLNQMPPIDRLVNYAWYPGTVQLRQTSCDSDACFDVTFHLYEHVCFSVCVMSIREHGAIVKIFKKKKNSEKKKNSDSEYLNL